MTAAAARGRGGLRGAHRPGRKGRRAAGRLGRLSAISENGLSAGPVDVSAPPAVEGRWARRTAFRPCLASSFQQSTLFLIFPAVDLAAGESRLENIQRIPRARLAGRG